MPSIGAKSWSPRWTICFDFERLEFTRDASDSKALNTRIGPMIIIAGSGMAESGRILHHLAHGASDPRNTILIVGFQAEHTLGRRIVERRPMLKIFGDEVPLRARVEVSMATARTPIAVSSFAGCRPSAAPRALPVYLVHGEPAAQDALAGLLRADGYVVTTPERGTRQKVLSPARQS